MAWFTGFPMNVAKSTSGKPEDLCMRESRQGYMTRPTQTSTISEHAHKTGHYPLLNEVKFIDRESHW